MFARQTQRHTVEGDANEGSIFLRLRIAGFVGVLRATLVSRDFFPIRRWYFPAL
jgi:hypothetical protein